MEPTIPRYFDDDADLGVLKGKKIAVIGYGSQGRGQSLNLRDSGLSVIIGLRPGKSWDRAKKEGFEVLPVKDAVKKADVVQILVPDELQAAAYRADIGPNLKPKTCLMFSHGFNIHFGQIVPPTTVDVIMVAPKGPGAMVRRTYEEGKGVPALIAIHQDASGKAKDIALAYAKGIGATRAVVLETSFREETETDLFGEQTVLCGGVSSLIKAGFETLVEAGYQPEIAYFEVCNELKLIIDLIHQGGLSHMRYSVSDTAEYGDYTRGPRVIDDLVKEEMGQILAEIQDGSLATEWILENQAGRPSFNAMKKMEAAHPIEVVGKKLRNMMPWLK